MEGKPVEIRGIGALGRACAGIEAVGVEVAALRAGVVEYTVQNHTDASLLCFPAKAAEILLGA